MSSLYQVYDLQKTYLDVGTKSFKIVLNPKNFKNAHGFSVDMVDSDSRQIQCSVDIWGRKLNVNFVVTDATADGVASIFVYGDDEKICQLNVWIIK